MTTSASDLGRSPNTFTPSAPYWTSPWPYTEVEESKELLESQWRRSLRDRAPSLTSYSSNYIFKVPTTPLVQQSSTSDLDPSYPSPTDGASTEKGRRRHTLPPHALQARSSPEINDIPSRYNGGQSSDPSPRSAFRQSYGHQYRRSLSSAWSLQASSPTMPPSDAHKRRRQSFGSDSSPLQRASMVGSYEESILHGWMSTPPSQPLNFTAKIGALGKGDCKPKFPPHIMVPFPAVFYSWSNDVRGGNRIDNEPSPYVGTIELHNQQPVRDRNEQNKTKNKTSESPTTSVFKRNRRSTDANAFGPPHGSYRIPEQGQLQIVIQNPNKTAVKLFIVPYDLAGMDPGTKTFIRQRSSSANENKSSGQTQTSPISRGRQRLRYMVHLNICCIGRGKYYLYHQIRVVFANRVPDNKEDLQCETLVPSPKYTPYHPARRSAPTSTLGTPLLRPTLSSSIKDPMSPTAFYGTDYGMLPVRLTTPPPPVPAIPFSLAVSQPKPGNHGDHEAKSRIVDNKNHENLGQSPLEGSMWVKDPETPGPEHRLPYIMPGSTRALPASSNSNDNGVVAAAFDRPNKGGRSYGSPNGGTSKTPEHGQGILAQKLRDISRMRDGGHERGHGSEIQENMDSMSSIGS